MQLKAIMSTTVEAVRPDETLERAHALMRRRGFHSLVVLDRGQVVGLLTEDALAVREAEGVASVADAMERRVITATPDMTVRQAARLMRGRAQRALPVIAGSRLAGIVTVSDLLDVLGGVGRPARHARATPNNRGRKPAS
jgi:CBS domain-containing protein